MKINPISKKLYTDSDVLIKKLHCPYRFKWGDLSRTPESGVRCCDVCDKSVYETKNMSDNEVVSLVQKDSSVCLKVDINSSNISVVNYDV